jgi:hypothetical protein
MVFLLELCVWRFDVWLLLLSVVLCSFCGGE